MTTRTRPPADAFARVTRDTSDEYATHRIENTDDPDYLAAMLTAETARATPRQERIAMINQRIAEVRDGE